MAKHKLFCPPGTWEAAAAANGYPGGITPGPEIGEHQGSFGLLGYSQGGADIDGTYLKQGYDLVTPLSLMDPFTMIAQIATNLAGWLQSDELGPLSIVRAVKTGMNHLNFWGPQTPTTVNV
jgi:hypothetical protein